MMGGNDFETTTSADADGESKENPQGSHETSETNASRIHSADRDEVAKTIASSPPPNATTTITSTTTAISQRTRPLARAQLDVLPKEEATVADESKVYREPTAFGARPKDRSQSPKRTTPTGGISTLHGGATAASKPKDDSDNDDLVAWKQRIVNRSRSPASQSTTTTSLHAEKVKSRMGGGTRRAPRSKSPKDNKATTISQEQTSSTGDTNTDLTNWKRRVANRRGRSPPTMTNNGNKTSPSAAKHSPQRGASTEEDVEMALLPGSIAMDGSKKGNTGSICIGNSLVVGGGGSIVTTTSRKSSTIDELAVKQNNNDLVAAEMVDDAEAVVYASNVQEDDQTWKRKMTCVGGIVVIVFGAILTTLLVVFISEEKREAAVYVGHPECDPGLFANAKEDTKRIVRDCFCKGVISTSSLELTQRQQDLYTRRVESETVRTIVAEYGLIQGQDYGFNVTTCHSLQQTLLTTSIFEDYYLEVESIENVPSDPVPLEVLDNFLFLVYLYVLLDGLNWTNQAGWLQDLQVCDWNGVGCSFVDSFSKLSLPNNNLAGNLTEARTWWQTAAPSLNFVDLSRNTGIYGHVAQDLLLTAGFMDTLLLEEIDLNGPLPTISLQEVDDPDRDLELSLNPRLDTLHLQGNQFTGTLPASWFIPRPSLGRGIRLRHLEVYSNQLTGTLPTEIGLAHELINLQIASNQMTGTLPSEMAALSHLEFLDVGNNQFEGPIPDFVGELPVLTMLSLYDSGLTGAIPESFCNSTTRSRRQRTRRLFVACDTTPLCSCCGYRNDTSTNFPVQLLCAEELPEFLIRDDFDGF